MRWLERCRWLLWGAFLLAGCAGGGPGGQPGPADGVAKSGDEAAPALEVKAVWPTPNDAFVRGEGPEAFVQPAASGRLESGMYGSTRNGGRRFHEGLDLEPLARDTKGEAVDEIRAALAGVVRHVNNRGGGSSYGRYVVLEHPGERPAVYTLYAHLASVEVVAGREVMAGQRLGVMGRSAGGYTIPKDRAHLHFEIGLRLTDAFDVWYKSRGFGNANEHGRWNGMNLAGLDPLAFYTRLQAGRLATVGDWLSSLPIAVTVRVERGLEPDFVLRYPSLVRPGAGDADFRQGKPYAWEIGFDPAGVPLRWERVSAQSGLGKIGKTSGLAIVVVRVDEAWLRAQPAKELVERTKHGFKPGEAITTALEMIF